MNKIKTMKIIFIWCFYTFTSIAHAQQEDFTALQIEEVAKIQDIIFLDDMGKTLDSEIFSKHLNLKVGASLDVGILIADIENLKKKLEATYPSIEMNIVPKDKSFVEIVFELQRNRLINRIIIESESENPKDLREKLKSIKGTFLRSSSVNKDKETIKSYFHNSGFPFAEVTSALMLSKDQKKVDIHYKVKLSSKELKVKKLTFLGINKNNRKKLKSFMTTKAKGLFSSKKPFSREVLDNDIKILKSFYKSNGYIDNEVSYTLLRDKKDKYLNIQIQVVKGKQLIIRSLEVRGNSTFSEKEIRQRFKIILPSAFSLKDQQKSLQRIRNLYGENGFALSQVQMNYDQKSQLMKLNIIEGKVQRILQIEVLGNSVTKNKVILESLKFNRSEIVDSRKIKKSIKALYKTGLFKDVKIDFIPITSDQGKVVIQVVENSTRVIQFSIGSVSGTPGAGASINERNLFGTGSSLSLSFMISKELSRLNLIYQDPHLFGSDYQLLASASHDRIDSFNFDAKKTAFKLMIEKQITKNLKLGLGTRLEYVTPENISDSYSDQMDLSNNKDVITGLISSFGYTIQNKDEDQNIESGANISMVLMPSFTNQDYFFKSMTNLTAFRNIRTNPQGGVHKISGRITLGYATEEAPFYEKFRGGGHGTARGFEQGSISAENGELGASTSVAANVTYSFPLYENALSGVIFLDAFSLGNSNMEMGDIRLVGGIGMRANINTSLINDSIEAGIAIPLIKRDGDITRPFYFIFGDYDPAYSL